MRHTVSISAFLACACVKPMSASIEILSAEGSFTPLLEPLGGNGSSISTVASTTLHRINSQRNLYAPGSSMCPNSHSIAASAFELPVASSAF